MARPDIEERARELARSKVPYVHARVVLAERPTSARPGDEALVLADGTMIGFVGGTCGETTIRAQGLALFESGDSLLLRITPAPEPATPGKVTVVNECLSGGTFEVFLEPVLPPATLVVVGASPIAQALRTIGAAAGLEVLEPDVLDDPGRLGAVSAVVVATHGRDEGRPLTMALRSGVPYVGLVASPRRGTAVLDALGLTPDERARVRTPAGLDIGARTAPEVALSILAELVGLRPRPAGRVAATGTAGGGGGVEGGTAVDPVCGMSVAMVPDSLHYDVPDGARSGQRFWFCGPGCLRAFAVDPDAYPS